VRLLFPSMMRGAVAVCGRGVRVLGHGARGLEGGQCAGNRGGHTPSRSSQIG